MADLLRFKLSTYKHKVPDEITITIPVKIIDKIYRHSLHLQQQSSHTFGFNQHRAPIAYLNEYYKEHLLNHLKEFLFKYVVISFLYQKLLEQRIIVIGEPRLQNIILNPQEGAYYNFHFAPSKPVVVRDWRYLPFKAPARKKYKDIDKQATNFITEERNNQEQFAQEEIAPGDWVFFEAILLNSHKKPLIKNLSEHLWLQISNEETSEPFRNLFIGKKLGDRFISDHLCLREYFGCQFDNNYLFEIFIKKILPYAYFCINAFKEQFRLKSERKAHQKIVEVYSSRNDLSLRRAMVEEAFSLLNRTYPIDIPESAIIRREKILRDELQMNPDYSVYKLQSDFNQKMRLLAEKQIREHLLTDYFALQENIHVEDHDVYQYLNLTKRARTKEFIHFLHPAIRANEEELPISHASLKLLCVKEKTINHILYHLTK